MSTKITENQKRISKLLGITFKSNDSYRTLKAKILDNIADTIGEKRREEPTDRQIDFAKYLGLSTRSKSKRLISAEIEDELEKRNIKALNKLKIRPGSIVQVMDVFGQKEYTVSSIKENGKIYFKGIGCPQAWATKIIKVVKS